MATSVLRELEELKSMLESPKRTFTPYREQPASTPRQAPEAMRTYTTALSSAEKSVDRLGRAIEAAEEEMEAALKRTTEVHRSQLKQKELELGEMQRVVGAKERSIESLRDTLATTKRTYESRLSQAESALALKDAEIKALMEELRVSRLEREAAELQLQREVVAQRGSEVEVREREAELAASARAKGEEAMKALSALKYERKEKDSLRAEAEDFRRQAQALADELHRIKQEGAYHRDRLEAEAEELRKRVKSERSIRKACEKWLRAELRSREEMELLLTAVRDAASSGAPASDLSHVERLIDAMRARVSPPRLPLRDGSSSPPLYPSQPPPPSYNNGVYTHTVAPTTSIRPAVGAGGYQAPTIASHQHQQQQLSSTYASPTAHATNRSQHPQHLRPSSPPLGGTSLRIPQQHNPAPGFSELALVRKSLEQDNRRLKGELLEARKTLSDKLGVGQR